MNFEELLHVARRNQLDKKEPVKYLQTKFKPPTKEQREKDKVLSEGVLKFLARKEEEEKKRKKYEERKREELAAHRALDPKTNRRIQHMLKRTKSANKSVMEDVDTTNTADTIAGPSQPDEDDYGFVSGESAAMFDKLLEKMYSTPSENEVKFAPSKKPVGGNLSNTKERVKMALLKQEEEEKGPHKRKRRKKEGGTEDDDDITFTREPDPDTKESDKANKPKFKRPAAPPPMDFMALLQLAEKKQFEPVAVEPKVKKEPEPDQLMTKKQRLEHERLQELKRQKELRLKAREKKDVPEVVGKPAMKRIPKVGQTSSEQRNETPKLNGSVKVKSDTVSNASAKPSVNIIEKIKTAPSIKTPKGIDKNIPKSKPTSVSTERVSKKPAESENDKLKRELDEALRLLKEKQEAVRLLEEKERLIKEKEEALAKLKKLEQREVKAKVPPPKSTPVKEKPVERPKLQEVKKVPEKVPVREFPPKDMKKAVAVPAKAVREFPPRDVRGIPKDSSGRPLTKEQKMQLLKKRLAEHKRRRIEDDEDEYDSELDDFIDDGPDPSMQREDVSRAISEIFKYDKNKYSRYDDDTECMESNWAQISKEEYYSAKCGLLEDLQDIQAEKMALARKKTKGKKK